MDFGSRLFLDSPFPTLSLCRCKRIIAANNAAVDFFKHKDLEADCQDVSCGSGCQNKINLEELHIAIQGRDLTWSMILEGIHEPLLRKVDNGASFSKNEAYVKFQRPVTVNLNNHDRFDSPTEGQFPRIDSRSLTGMEDVLYHSQQETVTAKIIITSTRHAGQDYCQVSFYSSHATQHHANREIHQTPAADEAWLSKCKTAMFDNVPLLGYITDPAGKITYLNKLTTALNSGVSSRLAPLPGDISDMWTDDFSRRLTHDELPYIQILKTRQELKPFKYGQIDPRTGRKWILRAWGCTLYDMSTGEFLGAAMFAEVMGHFDAMAETSRLERLKSFESICDTMPHFVWTADQDGEGQWFSSQWLEYTGLAPEAYKGMGWQQTIHPEDLPRFRQTFKEAHEKAINYEIEARCRRYDGTYRWMLKRGAPIKDSDGRVLIWTGTNTDIHDSVMARIRARHERDQIIKAMQHAQVNVWAVKNGSHKISVIEGNNVQRFRASQKGQISETFSRDSDEDLAKAWAELDDPQVLENAIQTVMRGEVPKAEIEVKWFDRWHKVLVIPDDYSEVSEDNVRGVIGCGIDITDEKLKRMLEIDNKQLSAEKHIAKEQSRMKSAFLANMSHELRTPVAGVIGLANLLLDSSLDDDQRDHAHAIQMSAQTLLMIVNDILDFSKVESGKLTLENIEFNPATLVTNLWKVMHYSAQQKSVDFTCILNLPDDLWLYGDPGRIRQILTNLVSNAIKFTQKGTVKLTATALESRKGRKVIFMVEDSGIGIKQDVLSNLFKPFQQGDSSTARLFGGSGLGLSISKSLASLMKGHIELDSNPDVGTTATFSVPLAVVDAGLSFSTDGPRCLLSHYLRPKVATSKVGSIDVNADDCTASTVGQENTSSLSTPALSPVRQTNRRTRSYDDRQRELSAPRSVKRTSDEERKAREALAEALPMSERKNTHILLAEDNAVNRLIAIRTIEKLGFSVSAVWNGKEALETLTKSRDFDESTLSDGCRNAVGPVPASASSTAAELPCRRPDLVLMDCQMPVMDGYCATQTIRNCEPFISDVRFRGIPIIAMTASAIQGDREKCFDAGMSDYLAKPVDAGALESMLVKWALTRKEEDETMLDSDDY